MRFTAITITTGSKLSERSHETGNLDAEVKAFFTRATGPPPFDVRQALTQEGFGHLEWQATANGSTCCFLSTYSHGELASTAVVLTGLDQGEDLTCLTEFQKLIEQAYKPAGFSPGRAIMAETRRPLLACSVWPNPAVPPADYVRLGTIERDFAASFIEAKFPGR